MSDELTSEIDVDEAIARALAGEPLIDVREQHEWDGLHATVAQLLPMSSIREHLAELPADKQLLIICHSGARSARVAGMLTQAGYDAVSVTGGMLAWSAAGGPVVTGA